jgi:hypothetical protein
VGLFVRILAVLLAAAALAPESAAALSLQPVGNFASPVYVTSDPNSANRLFVVEQDGRIQLRQAGTTTEFLDIDDEVLSAGEPGAGGEQGLFSVAFPPDHGTTGHLYVFYTGNDSGNLHVDEFDAGETPIEGTRREVLTIPHIGSAQNHNGGQLQFGPGGYLYASTGDGGTGGANAQDLSSLLGKVLRIDPAQSGADPYTVPAGNPFLGAPGEDEIWSTGLRNPWRFSFDRASRALTVADVGQGSWEEVDFEPTSVGGGRGDNFGWSCREGGHVFAASCGSAGPFTDPAFEYANDGGTCAITGGYVVRDPALGDLYGRYVYADLCGGEIRSMCPALPTATRDRSEGLDVAFPTSFGQDAAGRIYVASGAGPVSRLTGAAAPAACPQAPSPVSEDTAPPSLELDAKGRQSVDGKLRVRARVDEPADVELRAKVRLGGGSLRLGEEGATLAAGVTEKLKWKLGRRNERRVRRKLRNGKKAMARVKGAATDATGNTSRPASLRIKLVR